MGRPEPNLITEEVKAAASGPNPYRSTQEVVG